MNLRDIDIFRAIMQAAGASNAAELLGISQPAVSRALATLERDVGFRLFDRIKGRLTPTREGQLFHQDVRASFAGLDKLKQRAAQIREVGEGTLNIASLSALGHGVVPRAIAAFARKHPDVRVGYQVRTSNIVRDLVASGRADIGLAADEVDTTGVLHSIFTTPRAVCVMQKAHPLARRTSITPSDLIDVPLLTLSPDDTVRRAMDKAFTEAGIQPRIVVETPYSLSIAILAAQGVGIGLCNPMTVADDMVPDLAVRPFEPAIHFRTLLLRPPDGLSSLILKDFIAELYQARNAYSSHDA
ncbi:MAG: LysR substrate-binding domain-containing protein [Paracoccaceae bacterium]